MKKIYTCFVCGFPFAVEESECPEHCPSCNSTKEYFLEEPWRGDIRLRRIHVDPPLPDPDRDPYDISYHAPKDFPPHSMHGRVRRFVFPYDDLEETKDFFEKSMDWDIIPTKHSDAQRPLLFCATGPGNDNWEPSVPSFIYGYLKPREKFETEKLPTFIVEVDNVEETLVKTVEFGGKVLKERFFEEENQYAIIEDSEGNVMYIWQTPDDVDWTRPETQYLSRRPEKK